MLTLACQLTPLQPADILAKAKQNMAELQTYRLGMDLNIGVSGSTINMTAEGVAENPDRAYMTMEILGQEMEILILGPSEAYTRTAGQTEWTPVDAEALSQSTGVANAASQLQITDYATNIVKLEDEQIDGTTCYHLSMDVDTEKLMSVVNPSLADQVTYGTEPSHLEMWAGKQDLLIHKLTYALTVGIEGQDMDMTMALTFSDFNAAVEIPSP